jgi:hypothetical protein
MLSNRLGVFCRVIVATPGLYNFVRSRNYPIDEPQHILDDEEELLYAMGNAVRQLQALIQHFT